MLLRGPLVLIPTRKFRRRVSQTGRWRPAALERPLFSYLVRGFDIEQPVVRLTSRSRNIHISLLSRIAEPQKAASSVNF